MIYQIKDGDDPIDQTQVVTVSGIQLRDWFAGQALAGWAYADIAKKADTIANSAYALADAMLKAREGK